jgi:hypothetical protein
MPPKSAKKVASNGNTSNAKSNNGSRSDGKGGGKGKAAAKKSGGRDSSSGVDIMAELEAEEAEHRKRVAAKKAITKTVLAQSIESAKAEAGVSSVKMVQILS